MGLVRVEEVLGVVDHLLALETRKATDSPTIRRFSSRETRVTFSMCRSQVLPTMVATGAVLSARPRGRVLRRRHAPAARHAEGRQAGRAGSSRSSGRKSSPYFGLLAGKPASM